MILSSRTSLLRGDRAGPDRPDGPLAKQRGFVESAIPVPGCEIALTEAHERMKLGAPLGRERAYRFAEPSVARRPAAKVRSRAEPSGCVRLDWTLFQPDLPR